METIIHYLKQRPQNLPCLTDAQLKFIFQGGPLIAGPGSGKTTTMVWALHYMLVDQQYYNEEVYILSFTTAACSEFAERIERGWPGIKSHPDWDDWCKKHLRTVHSLAMEICAKFNRSERRQSKMVETALALLKENKELGKELIKNWIVIADEGQDSEPVQLSLLYRISRYITKDALVGDPRQCIFQFAGCRPKEFNHYLLARKNVNEILENFRSSAEIVDFVNNFVKVDYNFKNVNNERLQNYLEVCSEQIARRPANGKLPVVVHIQALSDNVCPKINNLHRYLRRALDNPAYSSVACLARNQFTMNKIYENLGLHPDINVPCIMLRSHTKLGYTQNIPEEIRENGNVVWLLNVHMAKGQEFDYVLYLVKGYSSEEAAQKAFDDLQDDYQRTEELHLHIVASSRAKEELCIVINGKVPPVYLRQALKTARVRYTPPDENFWTPDEDNETLPKDNTVISVRQLLDQDAAEGILEYTPRGIKGNNLEQSPLDCEKYLAGSLKDFEWPLLSGSLPYPDNYSSLCFHGLAGSFSCIVSRIFQICLCDFKDLRRTLGGILQDCLQLPLHTKKEGVVLKTKLLEKKTAEAASCFKDLVQALIEYFESRSLPDLDEAQANLNLQLGKVFVDAKTYKLLAKNLYKSMKNYVYCPPYAGNYCIGEATSLILRLTADGLRERCREGFSDKSVEQMFDLIFRDRSRFDYRTTLKPKEDMLRSAERILNSDVQEEVSPADLGRILLLEQMFQKDDREALGALIPLTASIDELKLSLDDFCLTPESYAILKAQVQVVRDNLKIYHTDAELERIETNVCVNYSVCQELAHEVSSKIQTIKGKVDVWVPGGTVLQIKAKAEIRLEDEVETLAYAALYDAQRAFLLDIFQGRLFIYHIRETESIDIIKAILKGVSDSKSKPNTFEKCSDDEDLGANDDANDGVSMPPLRRQRII